MIAIYLLLCYLLYMKTDNRREEAEGIREGWDNQGGGGLKYSRRVGKD
jgi:hypothetical protein